MFARFDENPAMTLRVIKETKRYGRTAARRQARTDNVKTVYPPQTKFAGGITTTTADDKEAGKITQHAKLNMALEQNKETSTCIFCKSAFGSYIHIIFLPKSDCIHT